MIENGRKTIVTVIEIIYNLAKDEYSHVSSFVPGVYNTAIEPSFTIRYRFNTPDDNEIEDLVLL